MFVVFFYYLNECFWIECNLYFILIIDVFKIFVYTIIHIYNICDYPNKGKKDEFFQSMLLLCININVEF